MGKEEQQIKEVVVVEGRDDTAAVKRALSVQTIETHGFGIREETWNMLKRAYRSQGLIIFTDPDHAGEEIRKKLTERFPEAKQAYLSREEALSDGDIGIENAGPEAIRRALFKARATLEEKQDAFSYADMKRLGLAEGDGAAEKREKLGAKLGIGYGNGKTFLRKLNGFGITMEELNEAILAGSNCGNAGKTRL